MTGRPSAFSQEMADTICAELVDGLSLRKICDRSDRPDKATVYRWLEANPAFRDQYARARELQGETFADELVDVVGEEEDPTRARVRMDARKWAASKLAPKKYGDKVTTELTGKDGGPIQTKDMTPLDQARLIAFALRKAERSLKETKPE